MQHAALRVKHPGRTGDRLLCRLAKPSRRAAQVIEFERVRFIAPVMGAIGRLKETLFDTAREGWMLELGFRWCVVCAYLPA